MRRSPAPDSGGRGRGRDHGIFTFAVVAGGVVAAMLGATLLLDLAVDYGARSMGVVDSASGRHSSIEGLDAHVRASPDGTPTLVQLMQVTHGDTIPVDQLTLALTIGPAVHHLSVAEAPGPGTFTVNVIRDSDGSVAHGVLNRGDMVELQVDLEANGLLHATGGQLTMDLTHAGGDQRLGEYRLHSGLAGQTGLLVQASR